MYRDPLTGPIGDERLWSAMRDVACDTESVCAIHSPINKSYAMPHTCLSWFCVIQIFVIHPVHCDCTFYCYIIYFI